MGEAEPIAKPHGYVAEGLNEVAAGDPDKATAASKENMGCHITDDCGSFPYEEHEENDGDAVGEGGMEG